MHGHTYIKYKHNLIASNVAYVQCDQSFPFSFFSPNSCFQILVRFLGPEIGLSQGLHLHKTTKQKSKTNYMHPLVEWDLEFITQIISVENYNLRYSSLYIPVLYFLSILFLFFSFFFLFIYLFFGLTSSTYLL